MRVEAGQLWSLKMLLGQGEAVEVLYLVLSVDRAHEDLNWARVPTATFLCLDDGRVCWQPLHMMKEREDFLWRLFADTPRRAA